MHNFRNNNSKIVGIFPQDSIVPKNFDVSKRNAKFDNIVKRRACHVPIILLSKPFKILAVQNHLKGVKFYRQGMMLSLSEHGKLMNLLINSVKYN
jgi:hypothetical protein